MPESTASELVATPDRMMRLWIALIGITIAATGWQTMITLNQQALQDTQAQSQRETTELKLAVQSLAVQSAVMTVQAEAHREAAAISGMRRDEAIQRAIDMYNQLLQRQN